MSGSFTSEKQQEFQAVLREAIESITLRGLDLTANEPARFQKIPNQPFLAYLPGLSADLQTPEFRKLLEVTSTLIGSFPDGARIEQKELLRFVFWQLLKEAAPLVDWEHPMRVARITAALGREVDLPETRLLELYWGGLLHDAGKVFIDDLARVLESRRTERHIILACIRTHAYLGSLFMKCTLPLFLLGETSASQHQESVDGSGYPLGLKYAQISREGILIGLADGYDATITRVHWSLDQVIEEDRTLFERAGVPDALERLAFITVARRYHSLWYPEAA